MISREILSYLGLSDHEAMIYLAALKSGESLPKHLSQEAGITRPLLYKLLPDLFAKGVLTQTVKGKRRYLIAEDPTELFTRRQDELALVEESLPELKLLLRTVKVKPKIVLYEGIKGIKRLYMDTLREREPILEVVSMKHIHPEIEFHSRYYYIPQRVRRKIPIKIIVSGAAKSRLISLKNDPYELREVRLIDEKKFPIPLDCYIYGDTVSFALYRTDSEPVGISLRSKEIAVTLRSLFESVWHYGCEKNEGSHS